MRAFLMKFSSKQISFFFLIISSILFFYILYKERIFHGGSVFSYYLNYYIVSIVLIVFSIISFKISKNIKINLILINSSILIGLYLIEGFLAYQYSTEKRSRELYIKKNNIVFDQRSKKEVFFEIKKTDPNVTVSLSPANWVNNKEFIKNEIHPLSGVSNSTTVFCNELGYHAIYKSDRYGFKNPDIEWKQKNNLQFVLIGDSFTQGACVNSKDDFAGNMRKFLKNDKKKPGVLNFGFRGQGPLGEYALLREYLPKIKTKRVILIYFENDLGNLLEESRNKILKKYLLDENFKQNLAQRNEEKDLYLRSIVDKFIDDQANYQESYFQRRLKKLIKLQNIRSLFINTQPTVSGEYIEVLKKTKNLIEKNGAKMYFVYLPSHKKYQKSFIKRAIWTKLRGPLERHSFDTYEEIIELVKSLEIPLVDLHEELFKSMEDPLSVVPLRSHGHFTEEGYEIVAKIIYNKINEIENNN